MIASVSGSRTETVVPRPTTDWMSTVPPTLARLEVDDVHPNAAAGEVGDLLGGGEAGREDEPDLSLTLITRSCSAV